jgi:type I restriction enzyme S subunit
MEAIIDYRGKTPRKTTSGIPLLTAKIVKGGRIMPPEEFIEPADFDAWMRRGMPKPGDVLITTEAPLGEVAQLGPERVALAQRLIALRGKKGLLDNRFLKYLLLSPDVSERIQARASGTTVMGIRQTELREVMLPFPPLVEQKAIARILGVLDDKIELNRRMNHTLETLARALFKSWFVDFDPVIAKGAGKRPVGMSVKTAALFPHRFEESKLGPIPKGWKLGSAAEIARFVNGRNFTKNATGTGRMVIRIAELNSGPGGATVYNDTSADSENTAYPGDLLFAWSGSLDVYRWHGDEALVNQHIFKVVCETHPEWFVHYHLQEAMPLFQGIAADKATTMGHIKREHLAHAEIALPPESVLAAAERVFHPLYERVHHAERQCLALSRLRDALLPPLMSGELRVRQAEKLVEANL